MSEKAPNTAVSAIIVVIIIFVAVIIFLNLSTDSSSQIIDLFNEVFYSEKNAEEEAKLATIKTQESFLNGIEECKSGTTVNPKGKEACFCHTGTLVLFLTNLFCTYKIKLQQQRLQRMIVKNPLCHNHKKSLV